MPHQVCLHFNDCPPMYWDLHDYNHAWMWAEAIMSTFHGDWKGPTIYQSPGEAIERRHFTCNDRNLNSLEIIGNVP